MYYIYTVLKDTKYLQAGSIGRTMGEYVFFPNSLQFSPFDGLLILEKRCIANPDLFQKV